MSGRTVAIGAVALAGGISAVIDLHTHRVPNWLTAATATLGLTLAGFHSTGLGLAAAAAGFVVGALLMLPGHLFGGTGGGDVKLLAALGTLLGPDRIFYAFWYAAIAGGVLAVAVAIRRGLLHQTFSRTAALVTTAGGNTAEIEHQSSNNRFAFAPAIALGTLAAALGF